MNEKLEQLVKQMFVDIKDAPDSVSAVEVKELYMALIATVVLDEFLGNNAELHVIDPLIQDKAE